MARLGPVTAHVSTSGVECRFVAMSPSDTVSTVIVKLAVNTPASAAARMIQLRRGLRSIRWAMPRRSMRLHGRITPSSPPGGSSPISSSSMDDTASSASEVVTTGERIGAIS